VGTRQGSTKLARHAGRSIGVPTLSQGLGLGIEAPAGGVVLGARGSRRSASSTARAYTSQRKR